MSRAGLTQLNAMAPEAAEAALLRVCGSRVWAREVAARRPFAESRDLLTAAENVWDRLTSDDWHEAFAAHPRIGESRTAAGAEASAWSSVEQSAAAVADESQRKALAEAQSSYEERFGHVFLIRAAGRSGGEILAACRERLGNDPATELAIAAGQEREIGRLRLRKLLDEDASGGGEPGSRS